MFVRPHLEYVLCVLRYGSNMTNYKSTFNALVEFVFVFKLLCSSVFVIRIGNYAENVNGYLLPLNVDLF